MRALVLGANGMLGHMLCRRWVERFELMATTRSEPSAALLELIDPELLITGVHADADGRPVGVSEAIAQHRPDVVVNCIGIVKQSQQASDPEVSIAVNSMFPHRVAVLCAAQGARLIHISTDCVFSGSVGGYAEDAVPDPVDLYGRSKLLGEVDRADALTIRTSIIGRELSGSHGLLEGMLAQRGTEVRGFSRAIFSGFTTAALADLLAALALRQPDLSGIRHLGATPISKLELLQRLNRELGFDLSIVPDDRIVVDRSLDSSRLRGETGVQPPSWTEMISELASDPAEYDRLR